ncbi:MAG: carbohydrate kinase family protein [bacterium]|nr:carbohydrate kinase family protein [bacterium]
MFDVVTIGAATRDVFLRSGAWEVREDATSPTGLEQCLPLGAKIEIAAPIFTTGGGAMNAAVTFAQLGGLRTATVCRVGDDAGAAEVRGALQEHGVDTRLLQRDGKRSTAYAVILLSGTGQRTILVHRGASSAIAVRDIAWSHLRARWISLSSLGGDLALARRVLRHAREHGIAVAWNPGSGELAAGTAKLLPLLRDVTVFNVNREEAMRLLSSPSTEHAEVTLARLCAATNVGAIGDARYVLMTDGARGAYACVGGSTWFASARKVKAVNTTGAGDAFGSGFTTGLALGWDAPTALRLGMTNAESVIQHMGAQRGILKKLPAKVTLAKYRIAQLAIPRP